MIWNRNEVVHGLHGNRMEKEGAMNQQEMEQEMKRWPAWMMFVVFFVILAAYVGVPYFTGSGALGYFAAVSVPAIFFGISRLIRKIRKRRDQ
jgi:hypothetical protein